MVEKNNNFLREVKRALDSSKKDFYYSVIDATTARVYWPDGKTHHTIHCTGPSLEQAARFDCDRLNAGLELPAKPRIAPIDDLVLSI